MKYLKYTPFVFVLLVFTTCIAPLTDIKTDSGPRLVVDGFITDEPGPHNVQVTFFESIDTSVRPNSGLPTSLNISIIDETSGETVVLRRNTEVQKEFLFIFTVLGPPHCLTDGTFRDISTAYQTPPSFQGIVGHTYILEVTLNDGRRYHSTPQTILPSPEIDSLILNFKEIPAVERERPGSGVEVSVMWDDPEEANFYFWQLDGIYRVNTPDIRDRFNPLDLEDYGCPCWYDIEDEGLDACWIIENNLMGNVTAFSDSEVNGRQVTMAVGTVVDNGLRFNDRLLVSDDKQYYLDVEQYAISEEAFLYNEQAAILREVNGEIFDPPPLTIVGNISNVEDESDKLIGFFGAYGIQRKDIFIHRDILEFMQPAQIVCGDCRLRRGAQVETPAVYR